MKFQTQSELSQFVAESNKETLENLSTGKQRIIVNSSEIPDLDEFARNKEITDYCIATANIISTKEENGKHYITVKNGGNIEQDFVFNEEYSYWDSVSPSINLMFTSYELLSVREN